MSTLEVDIIWQLRFQRQRCSLKYYKYVDEIDEDLHPIIYKVEDENQLFYYFNKLDGWLQAFRTWKDFVHWMKSDPQTKDVELREITEQEVFIEVI